MARPSLFKPEMAQTLQDLVAQGHSLGEVAAELGVSRMTLHRWMQRYVTTLRQPLKDGLTQRAANRAAEAERLYGIRHARNRQWLRLPPRPSRVDATAARATLGLLLTEAATVAPDALLEAGEPIMSAIGPAQDQEAVGRHSEAHPRPEDRLSDRRRARQRSSLDRSEFDDVSSWHRNQQSRGARGQPIEPQEPHDWQNETDDGEALPMEDPLAEW
ncbi:helix-turn-helix domain-containing protein [Mesorhizobium sp. M0478]|uniref:helix-turn-helix domain-containing protein n=2 Tax=unclassified Mesorhizobium TaxID=325217 RepID=UPI003334C4D1